MSKGREFIEKVRKTISKYEMIDPGDRIVAAVSGGPDSVCLLHVLHRLSGEMGHELVVAHFNHGWRPGEDERETELVRSLAGSLGLPFETARAPFDTMKCPLSREEAAREARYRFLEDVREKFLAGKIAVGHHLHDQAETFLMRLLRGSGSTGLSSIPPVREGVIIRPFIEIKRPEIEAYCKEQGLTFAIDSSNLRTGNERNRIRLELMPLLLGYQPKIVEILGETASVMKEESEYLGSLAAEWLRREAKTRPESGIEISLPHFLALHAALRKRVVRTILLGLKGDIRRIGRVHIQAVDSLAFSERSQGSLDLPDRLSVRRVYDRLFFSFGKEERRKDFSYCLMEAGVVVIREIGKSLTIREMGRPEEFNFPSSPWTVYLDADKAVFPLIVRNFRPGDRFVPLGMKGHRKIKDFFVDLKVPMDLRRATPLLCLGEAVVWICGFRIDESFKIVPSTKRILEASLL